MADVYKYFNLISVKLFCSWVKKKRFLFSDGLLTRAPRTLYGFVSAHTILLPDWDRAEQFSGGKEGRGGISKKKVKEAFKETKKPQHPAYFLVIDIKHILFYIITKWNYKSSKNQWK